MWTSPLLKGNPKGASMSTSTGISAATSLAAGDDGDVDIAAPKRQREGSVDVHSDGHLRCYKPCWW